MLINSPVYKIDLDRLFNILKRNNKNCKVIITFYKHQKDKILNYLMNYNINSPNSYIGLVLEISSIISEEIPLYNFVETERLSQFYLEGVNKLSPLEQFIYLYNTVKQYKDYKLEGPDEDTELSRSVYEILFNDYMCCCGFCDLLRKFCKKIDKIQLL